MQRLSLEGDHCDYRAEVLEWGLNAQVFDCLQLPLSFVEDTGEAKWHELEETKGIVRLPFPICYFELPGRIAVLAHEEWEMETEDGYTTTTTEEGEKAPVIVFVPYLAWDRWNLKGEAEDLEWESYTGRGEFVNWENRKLDEKDDFFGHDFSDGDVISTVEGERFTILEGLQEAFGKLMLGVCSLLDDKLLATTVEADPASKLTQARAKRGRLPISGERRILTVNVAAVRRITKPLGGTHESPCLHWRRGHHRVLHRGSEFESKTWVSKCLVGDPSRGYIRKTYQLVKQEQLLAGIDSIERGT